MDTAGFAPVDDVLRLAWLNKAELVQIIEENNKSRYELSLDGARIRARQGHSLAGTPVTLEGLESSWVRVTDDAVIHHGTNLDAARSILTRGPTEGIHPGERTHVHLAESEDSKVGKRAQVAVLLAVSPVKLREAGLDVFRSPNGVILVRRVPHAAIVGVKGQTRDGVKAEAALLALLA
jgi:putative RNA 2'-phosphotransferase